MSKRWWWGQRGRKKKKRIKRIRCLCTKSARYWTSLSNIMDDGDDDENVVRIQIECHLIAVVGDIYRLLSSSLVFFFIYESNQKKKLRLVKGKNSKLKSSKTCCVALSNHKIASQYIALHSHVCMWCLPFFLFRSWLKVTMYFLLF